MGFGRFLVKKSRNAIDPYSEGLGQRKVNHQRSNMSIGQT